MMLVLIGPPGSGKGTQCKRLLAHLAIPHLSTGELLREAKSQDSQLGRTAAQYMDQGKLVPDSLVLELVAERLTRPEFASGCLFDGFPRTLEQARSLDASLAARGTPLSHVVELKVDEQEVIGRLLKRAQIEGRADDNAETIRQRMQVYQRQTVPLLDYYRKQGVLVAVDATGTPDEVFGRIQQVVDARR
jgi:adenylate kinase